MGELIENREQYVIRWLYNKTMWVTGHITKTYDQAVELVNNFKNYDKNHGQEFKYRIVKQTVQEEVVYDETQMVTEDVK